MISLEKSQIEDDIYLYKVSNGRISFTALNYGCILKNIFVLDKDSKPIDILLGCDTLDEYKKDKASLGAVVGRVANRIGGAKFLLDGKVYNLDKNTGSPVEVNTLHGGFNRWGDMVWQGEFFNENDRGGIVFSRRSVDGEQGFPGNLDVKLSYLLTENDEIEIIYEALTDKASPVNLTNHAYFNLDGGDSVLDYKLHLYSEKYISVDSNLLPTGEIPSVKGTPFDFTQVKNVGKDIEKFKSPSEDKPYGYDHCFVTNAEEGEIRPFGEIWSEKSGIKMEISTNQRGIHIYTGNYLGGLKGKNGKIYKMHEGICFESERFPNAINVKKFPDSVLRPGEKYFHKTVFSFKTIK